MEKKKKMRIVANVAMTTTRTMIRIRMMTKREAERKTRRATEGRGRVWSS